MAPSLPAALATFTGTTQDEILAQVAVHAREAHGIEAPPLELVEQVKAKTEEVPA